MKCQGTVVYIIFQVIWLVFLDLLPIIVHKMVEDKSQLFTVP